MGEAERVEGSLSGSREVAASDRLELKVWEAGPAQREGLSAAEFGELDVAPAGEGAAETAHGLSGPHDEQSSALGGEEPLQVGSEGR